MKNIFSCWELGTEHSKCKAISACHVEFSVLFTNQNLSHRREPPKIGTRLVLVVVLVVLLVVV